MNANEPAALRAILAHARAGATTRAWDAFVAAGFERVAADPKVLTLKGRLLKDRARKARGGARERLYLQSAKAYAAAATLRPDSYPLINAATMSLFAGQTEHMALLAQQVLTMFDTGAGLGETPYWHEATRAEALFLIGRQSDAKVALDKAVQASPAAWEDRAATLRQFRLISEFRGETVEWLKPYSPPVTLHFKGMIGVSPDDENARNAAFRSIEALKPGFAYGALAAGADILIAEALIANDAELHLVLPILPSTFRRFSVEPFGEKWVARFDRLFELAASVAVVSVDDCLTEENIAFAAMVAKGAAAEMAARFETRASGLELSDSMSSQFDPATDSFIPLERTAPFDRSGLARGDMLRTVVSDRFDNEGQGWKPLADSFAAHEADSAAAAYSLLARLRSTHPQVRCAVGFAPHVSRSDDADAHMTRVLRMAQCATPGTAIADASSARAILSVFPLLRHEPLGELADAGGAIEIHAIAPVV